MSSYIFQHFIILFSLFSFSHCFNFNFNNSLEEYISLDAEYIYFSNFTSISNLNIKYLEMAIKTEPECYQLYSAGFFAKLFTTNVCSNTFTCPYRYPVIMSSSYFSGSIYLCVPVTSETPNGLDTYLISLSPIVYDKDSLLVTYTSPLDNMLGLLCTKGICAIATTFCLKYHFKIDSNILTFPEFLYNFESFLTIKSNTRECPDLIFNNIHLKLLYPYTINSYNRANRAFNTLVENIIDDFLKYDLLKLTLIGTVDDNKIAFYDNNHRILIYNIINQPHTFTVHDINTNFHFSDFLVSTFNYIFDKIVKFLLALLKEILEELVSIVSSIFSLIFNVFSKDFDLLIHKFYLFCKTFILSYYFIYLLIFLIVIITVYNRIISDSLYSTVITVLISIVLLSAKNFLYPSTYIHQIEHNKLVTHYSPLVFTQYNNPNYTDEVIVLSKNISITKYYNKTITYTYFDDRLSETKVEVCHSDLASCYYNISLYNKLFNTTNTSTDISYLADSNNKGFGAFAIVHMTGASNNNDFMYELANTVLYRQAINYLCYDRFCPPIRLDPKNIKTPGTPQVIREMKIEIHLPFGDSWFYDPWTIKPSSVSGYILSNIYINLKAVTKYYNINIIFHTCSSRSNCVIGTKLINPYSSSVEYSQFVYNDTRTSNVLLSSLFVYPFTRPPSLINPVINNLQLYICRNSTVFWYLYPMSDADTKTIVTYYSSSVIMKSVIESLDDNCVIRIPLTTYPQYFIKGSTTIPLLHNAEYSFYHAY